MISADSGQILCLRRDEHFIPIERFNGIRVRRIASGYNKSCIIDKDDRIHWVDENDETEEMNSFFSQIKIHDLSLGKNFGLVVDANGYLYGWGENTYGQLGLGHCDTVLEPEFVHTLKTRRVQQISCGEKHSACLTEHGDLYTFGRGLEGQCGHFQERDLPMYGLYLKPKFVDFFKNIPLQKVLCASNYTLVLSKSGDVYTFGENINGQLGQGNIANNHVPQCILKNKNIIDISCGYCHTLALSENGTVYGWGLNIYGQIQFTSRPILTPIVLKYKNLKSIYCNGHHTIIIDQDEKINLFGYSRVECLRSYTDHLTIQGSCIHGSRIAPRDNFYCPSVTITNNIALFYTPTRIIGISPLFGSIAGGTKLTIKAIGLYALHDKVPIVRFFYGDGIVPRFVEGVYSEQDETITCLTPDCNIDEYKFTKNDRDGKYMCRVDISCNQVDFTRSPILYQYYEPCTIEYLSPSIISSDSQMDFYMYSNNFYLINKPYIKLVESIESEFYLEYMDYLEKLAVERENEVPNGIDNENPDNSIINPNHIQPNPNNINPNHANPDANVNIYNTESIVDINNDSISTRSSTTISASQSRDNIYADNSDIDPTKPFEMIFESKYMKYPLKHSICGPYRMSKNTLKLSETDQQIVLHTKLNKINANRNMICEVHISLDGYIFDYLKKDVILYHTIVDRCVPNCTPSGNVALIKLYGRNFISDKTCYVYLQSNSITYHIPTYFISTEIIAFYTPQLSLGKLSLCVTYNQLQFSQPIELNIYNFKYKNILPEQGSLLGTNKFNIYFDDNQDLFAIPDDQIKIKFTIENKENNTIIKNEIVDAQMNVTDRSISCIVPFCQELPREQPSTTKKTKEASQPTLKIQSGIQLALNGKNFITLPFTYNYVLPPTVSAIKPNSGKCGSTVTFTCTNIFTYNGIDAKFTFKDDPNLVIHMPVTGSSNGTTCTTTIPSLDVPVPKTGRECMIQISIDRENYCQVFNYSIK